MQLDTGCAFSLAPKSFYTKYCSHLSLQPTEVIFSTYNGERIHPLGEVMVDIEYANRCYSLPLIIVNVGSTPLVGRNWLSKVALDRPSLPVLHKAHSTASTTKQNLYALLKKHETLFDSTLGCYNGPPEQRKVKEQPKFHKPRPVA